MIKLKVLIVLMSFFSSLVLAQTARIFTVTADEWAQPRSGQVVATYSGVRNAVEYWQKVDDALFLIRYPGEDSGELWASELKDWMVSLGVPNDYILLAPGLDSLDQVEIVVAKSGELTL